MLLSIPKIEQHWTVLEKSLSLTASWRDSWCLSPRRPAQPRLPVGRRLRRASRRCLSALPSQERPKSPEAAAPEVIRGRSALSHPRPQCPRGRAPTSRGSEMQLTARGDLTPTVCASRVAAASEKEGLRSQSLMHVSCLIAIQKQAARVTGKTGLPGAEQGLTAGGIPGQSLEKQVVALLEVTRWFPVSSRWEVKVWSSSSGDEMKAEAVLSS